MRGAEHRPECQECGAWRRCQRPFMGPEIPDGWTGLALVVGERPGQDEDRRSGRPFTGPAGQLLRELLRRAGFADTDVALVNAVQCAAPQNRTPTMHEVHCCRGLLLECIRTLQPKVVVALGGTALKALVGAGDVHILRARGRALRLE